MTPASSLFEQRSSSDSPASIAEELKTMANHEMTANGIRSDKGGERMENGTHRAKSGSGGGGNGNGNGGGSTTSNTSTSTSATTNADSTATTTTTIADSDNGGSIKNNDKVEEGTENKASDDDGGNNHKTTDDGENNSDGNTGGGGGGGGGESSENPGSSPAQKRRKNSPALLQARKRLYSKEHLEIFEMIETPVWVFDATNKGMWWANSAACFLWNAPDWQSLRDRDFKTDMSRATEVVLKSWLEDFKIGETHQTTWTFHPDGGKVGPRTCELKMSGIDVTDTGLEEDKQACMLVEVLEVKEGTEQARDPTTIRRTQMLRHFPIIARQFDFDGNLMDQNAEAMTAFGSPENAVYASELIARNTRGSSTPKDDNASSPATSTSTSASDKTTTGSSSKGSATEENPATESNHASVAEQTPKVDQNDNNVRSSLDGKGAGSSDAKRLNVDGDDNTRIRATTAAAVSNSENMPSTTTTPSEGSDAVEKAPSPEEGKPAGLFAPIQKLERKDPSEKDEKSNEQQKQQKPGLFALLEKKPVDPHPENATGSTQPTQGLFAPLQKMKDGDEEQQQQQQQQTPSLFAPLQKLKEGENNVPKPKEGESAPVSTEKSQKPPQQNTGLFAPLEKLQDQETEISTGDNASQAQKPVPSLFAPLQQKSEDNELEKSETKPCDDNDGHHHQQEKRPTGGLFAPLHRSKVKENDNGEDQNVKNHHRPKQKVSSRSASHRKARGGDTAKSESKSSAGSGGHGHGHSHGERKKKSPGLFSPLQHLKNKRKLKKESKADEVPATGLFAPLQSLKDEEINKKEESNKQQPAPISPVRSHTLKKQGPNLFSPLQKSPKSKSKQKKERIQPPAAAAEPSKKKVPSLFAPLETNDGIEIQEKTSEPLKSDEQIPSLFAPLRQLATNENTTSTSATTDEVSSEAPTTAAASTDQQQQQNFGLFAPLQNVKDTSDTNMGTTTAPTEQSSPPPPSTTATADGEEKRPMQQMPSLFAPLQKLKEGGNTDNSNAATPHESEDTPPHHPRRNNSPRRPRPPPPPPPPPLENKPIHFTPIQKLMHRASTDLSGSTHSRDDLKQSLHDKSKGGRGGLFAPLVSDDDDDAAGDTASETLDESHSTTRLNQSQTIPQSQEDDMTGGPSTDSKDGDDEKVMASKQEGPNTGQTEGGGEDGNTATGSTGNNKGKTDAGTEQCDFLAQFLQPEEGQRVLDEVRKGKDYSTELQMMTVEGPKWFTLDVRSIKDPITSEPVIIYSARDITQIMVSAQEEANRQSMKRNEFFAVMAHEIRTPLHQVVGFIELLASSGLNPEQTECVDMLQGSAHALMAIINDLLDFTKLEAGKMKLEAIPFEVRGVLDGTVAAIQPQAHDKGLNVRCRVDPGIPIKLMGDPNRLRQIVLNMLTNAVKFTSSGEVVIESKNIAKDDGVLLRFTVADTGIGIPKEKCDRIFNAYQQADVSVSRNYGGTGLGLAICKSLVEMMGGSIGVDSVPGVGTKFWFEIPYGSYVKGHHPEEIEKNNKNAEKVRSLRILVAEDNKVNQKVVCKMLQRLGHVATVVPNGQEAVTEVLNSETTTNFNNNDGSNTGDGTNTTAFDVVLMDWQMPVMDGIDATKEIRRKGYSMKGLPIVGLTASIQGLDWFKIGMNDCLKKPIRISDLKAALIKNTTT